ncbi:hypothetical protein DRQ11_08030, partial [candidate division KSB1 bacterium]
ICEMCGMAIVYDETMVKSAQIFKKSLEVASLSVKELSHVPLPEAKELRNLLKDNKTYSLDGGRVISISEVERNRLDGGKYSSADKKDDDNYSKLLIIFEENKELLEKYIEKCRKIFGYTRDEIIKGPFHKDSKKTTSQKYSLLIFPQIKKFTMQKDSASSEKPVVLALGGGTGLLVTIKALVKLGVKVISVQCSIDDGGSTFRLIKALIEKGYGWFPSPGDLVNSLFQGFASQDKLYRLLDDQGRIEVKKIKEGDQEKEKIVFYGEDNNIEYLDSFEELIIKLLQRIVAYTVGSQKDKGIGYFKKTYTLGDDFVWFAAGVINLTKRVNRYFEKGIIPLKGASIRNLLLLGAIDYLGLIDIDNPPYKDAEIEKKYTPSIDNPSKASQFQASLDKLAEMAGIYNGKVTLSHYKPATVYCIYEENVIIIQGDNNRNIALVVKVEKDKVKITIPTYRNETYILTPQKPFHKINIEGITIKLIRTREGKFSFQINDSPQATLLSEPQKKEETYNTYIEYDGKEYLLANDGTGRIIFKDKKVSQEEDEDIYVYSHLTMGGRKVYILSRFNAMQTCVTETVNFSKIIDFGIVEIEGWRKIKIKEGEYEEEPIYKPSNARISPNEELIKVINNEEVKAIIIGPGSFFTSILPHFLVRGLPEALAERRKRGDIPIVLVLNPTIDNETYRLSLEDIWRFIEKKTGYRIDELFTDVIFPRLDTTKLEEYFEISNPSFSWYVEKIVESEELINELRLSYINILINRFQEKLKLPRVSLDKDAPRYRLLNDDGKKLRVLKENKEIELEEVNLFEYLEAKIYEFLKTLKETRNPDIRTDKGAASKEAKKSVGAFNYSYEDIQKTRSIYPRLNLHWDVYTVGIDYVLPRKPGESPKPRVGFLLDYTYPVLGEILNLTSKEEEIYQTYKKVIEEAGILLEPFEAFTAYRANIREKLSGETADYFEMIGKERFEEIIQKRLLSDRFHKKPENFNLDLPPITFSVKLTQKGFSIKEKGNENYKDVLLKVLNDLLQSVHLIEEEFKIVITTDEKLLSSRISHHNISEKTIYLHPEFFKESLEDQRKFLYHELVSHISNKEPYEARAVIDTERFMKAPYPLRLYRKAKAYIEDGRHHHALYLLSQAQISLLQEKEGDEIINSFLKEIEGLKEYIEKNPNFRLNTIFLQAVKEDTGEIIQTPEEGKINWIEAHMKGIWHLNIHILIFNSKGEILLHRRRDKKGKRDISATHHLFFGENPQEAAKRIIKEDTGLSYIDEKTLIELELPQGKRKIGKREFEKSPYYDEDGTFYSSSKEIYNREWAKFYLYILSPEEEKIILSAEAQIKEIFEVEFVSLEEFIEDIKTHSSEFASPALQIFYSEKNQEVIKKRLYDELREILEEASKTPFLNKENLSNLKEGLVHIINLRKDWEEEKNELPEDIKRQLEKLIEQKRKKGEKEAEEEFIKRMRSQHLKEIESLYQKAVVLATWNVLKDLYKKKRLNLYDFRKAIELMKDLGVRDKLERATLHSLLLIGCDLEFDTQKGKFVFKKDSQIIKDIWIDLSEGFKMSEEMRRKIGVISRGALAVDMDLTQALRDESIDIEILTQINNLLMLGFLYAVVSANEFAKQYVRSLTEFIPDELITNFILYVNGAGLKIKFRKDGDYYEDTDYTKSFSEYQIKEIENILEKVKEVWRKVIEILRKEKIVEIIERGEFNESKKREIIEKIKNVLEEFKGLEGNIANKISSKLDIILEHIYQILTAKREKKYKEKLKSHLSSKENIRIEKRGALESENIIQITLKPIYPTKKRIESEEESAREFLAEIVRDLIEKVNKESKNLGEATIVIKEGGDTSIDILREDVSKKAAAEDLIKEAELDRQQHLLVAIDDEMNPTGVGFDFLKLPITVISVEERGNKREYTEEEEREIKAKWFWSKEQGFGSQIEGTKGILRKLEELYEEEVRKAIEGKEVKPAIERLRECLRSDKDGGEKLDNKDNYSYPLSVPEEFQEIVNGQYAKIKVSEDKARYVLKVLKRKPHPLYQETINLKLNPLSQLIKGYKNIVPPDLERIFLDNKFSDGGNANDLSPAIRELSKDKTTISTPGVENGGSLNISSLRQIASSLRNRELDKEDIWYKIATDNGNSRLGFVLDVSESDLKEYLSEIKSHLENRKAVIFVGMGGS